MSEYFEHDMDVYFDYRVKVHIPRSYVQSEIDKHNPNITIKDLINGYNRGEEYYCDILNKVQLSISNNYQSKIEEALLDDNLISSVEPIND